LSARTADTGLPANCRLHTFDAASKLHRGLRFERTLAAEMHPRPRGVLAHMAPIYAVLAAPLCRPLRVPLLLWYTHWRATRVLQVAVRVSDRIVTVDERTFPLESPKVVATGHGIDLEEFPCGDRATSPGLRVLSLSRYSFAKGIDTIIRAVAAVPGARLVHHGPALTAEERDCRQELEDLVAGLGLGGRVTLADEVPRSRVPELFARADVLVNNMRPGAADKVVYEAAAACVPVLASNAAFDDLLPPALRFPSDDADVLARRLEDIGSNDLRALGHELRARVAQAHSVDTWADRVLRAAS
jgi:glycosyltransferase involved in cell wall biosynthesis